MPTTTTRTAWVTSIALIASLGLLAGCSALPGIPGVPGVSIDDDGEGGKVTIEGDDGESFTVDTDTDGEIPEWLPSELPLPETYTVSATSVIDGGEGKLMTVNLSSLDGFDALVATVDAGLAAAGLTPESRDVAALGDLQTAMFGVPLDGQVWMINIIDYGTEDEETHVSYSSIDECSRE
ncbi:MAG: hypothetical protein M3Y52_09990 [Actinomycetota bacterium]|nr:hypothetical protein [Actinomycetota bacterium]